MRALVIETERAWQALGKVCYGASEAEKKSLAFRRSLYAVRDIAAGETLTTDNVRAIRPGYGLAPKHLEHILGKAASQPLKRGTPLTWENL